MYRRGNLHNLFLLETILLFLRLRAILTLSKDLQLIPLASGNLTEKWEEVEGVSQWILAHYTAWMTSRGIEISQQRSIPWLYWFSSLLCIVPLRIDEVRDYKLDC